MQASYPQNSQHTQLFCLENPSDQRQTKIAIIAILSKSMGLQYDGNDVK